MEKEVKLTKLANCAGCGAKVGAGVLAKLLDGLKVRQDPNLLVGFDKSDDASVYKVSDDLALVQTVDFFPPIARCIRYCTAAMTRRMKRARSSRAVTVSSTTSRNTALP